MPNGECTCARRSGRNSGGFTLIELLVVMTIVGLLLSLALPRYWRSLDRAKETVLKEDLRVFRSAIDKFYGDKGRYPQDLQEVVSQGYLRSVPSDPITESDQTWMPVSSNDSENPGVMDVRSGALGSTGDGVPYVEF